MNTYHDWLRHTSTTRRCVTKRIAITLSDWMFNDLEERAKRREITIPELIRRAVSLDRLLDQTNDPIFIGEGRDRRQILRPD